MVINSASESLRIWIPKQKSIKDESFIRLIGNYFDNLENTRSTEFEGRLYLINHLGSKLNTIGSVGQIHVNSKGWFFQLSPTDFFADYPTPYLITNWNQINFCFHGSIEIQMNNVGKEVFPKDSGFILLNLDLSENIFAIMYPVDYSEDIVSGKATVYSCSNMQPIAILGLPVYFDHFDSGNLGFISKLL